MLMAILEFRAKVCMIYQKFQLLIDIVFKFAVAYLAITTLNTFVGYDSRLTGTTVTLGLSAVSAVTPAGVLALICLLLTVAHVYSVNVVLAIFVALILLVLYAFFLRFTPRYAYVMIAFPILTFFNIPYAIPLLAGLTTTPVTIFPMWCGIFFKYLITVIRSCVLIQVDLSNLDPANLLALVNTIADKLLESKEMVYYMVVYAAVETVVFVIRKLKFNYSFEASIITGAAFSILGHIIIDGKNPIEGGIQSMVIFTLNSLLIVFILYSFVRILDYTAVENVQFEDDDYFYYVRAVPKIKTGLPKLKIRSMDSQTYFESSMAHENFEDDPYTDPETGEVLMPEKFSKAFAKKKKAEERKAQADGAEKFNLLEKFPFLKKLDFRDKINFKKLSAPQKKESKVVIVDDEKEASRINGYDDEADDIPDIPGDDK